MIFAISAKQPNLEGQVDERFGRCEYLIFFNSENNSFETQENLAASQQGGAGVAAAQAVIDNNAQAVISGAFGPNASRALQAAGIEMYLFTPDVKTIQQAIDSMQRGELQKYAG